MLSALSSKFNKLIHLLVHKFKGIFFKQVGVGIQLLLYVGDVNLQRHHMQIHLIANPGKIVDSPDIDVLAR